MSVSSILTSRFFKSDNIFLSKMSRFVSFHKKNSFIFFLRLSPKNGHQILVKVTKILGEDHHILMSYFLPSILMSATIFLLGSKISCPFSLTALQLDGDNRDVESTANTRRCVACDKTEEQRVHNQKGREESGDCGGHQKQ